MWMISCIYNTLKVPEGISLESEIRAEYDRQFPGNEDYDIFDDIFYDLSVSSDGTIHFEEENEFSDFLEGEWEDLLVTAFCNARVTGVIIWISLEGDNKGSMWGHEFYVGESDKVTCYQELKGMFVIPEPDCFDRVIAFANQKGLAIVDGRVIKG